MSEVLESVLNLQQADAMLLLTYTTEVGNFLQLPSRLFRRGRKGDVMVFQVVMNKTIEELAIRRFLCERISKHHFVMNDNKKDPSYFSSTFEKNIKKEFIADELAKEFLLDVTRDGKLKAELSFANPFFHPEQ